MALQIAVYRIVKAEYGFDRYVGLNFAADFNLNGDPDHACMAAGNMIAGLPAMYAGDPIKVVVKLWGKKVAQWVGVPKRKEYAFEEMANFVQGRMHGGAWAWCAQRAAMMREKAA